MTSGYRIFFLLVLIAATAAPARGGETAEQRGYRLLLTKPYLPPDFDQQTFDEVWRTWPEPLRLEAEKATLTERRRMAYARYGLTERPGDQSGKPLQYVVDDQGNWVMNCLSCHGGNLLGKPVPGLPNSQFALATLTEEIRTTKLRLGKPLARMDLGSLFIPLGTTNGTTNAVMFGVILMALRDADLNIVPGRALPRMVHHDMDPPPWWHFKKRTRLYIDGFVAKGHRPLLQFMLVKENGPEKFRQWEEDFKDIFAWMNSLQRPPYPFPIDRRLASEGASAFGDHCVRCHGTHGTNWTYPSKIVPIDEVGTDRVRLDALMREHRAAYGRSWFARYGKDETIEEPAGYVAPPLDGIWATAPYLHNGSVPTLWHMLRPEERPVVWSRADNEYDRRRLGFSIETFAEVPETIVSPADRRAYFDTRRFGKSAGGHRFPDELDDREKRAVLEYLKTL